MNLNNLNTKNNTEKYIEKMVNGKFYASDLDIRNVCFSRP